LAISFGAVCDLLIPVHLSAACGATAARSSDVPDALLFGDC
jgi:hypothetical protein